VPSDAREDEGDLWTKPTEKIAESKIISTRRFTRSSSLLFALARIPCSLSEHSGPGAAGMKGKVNRAVARQSEGGFGYVAISL
jgi:hypothetical protein